MEKMKSNEKLSKMISDEDNNIPRASIKEDNKYAQSPAPTDFAAYVPWACKQLQMPFVALVIKSYQDEYVSTITGARNKRNETHLKERSVAAILSDLADADVDSQSTCDVYSLNIGNVIIKLTAVFEGSTLVEILFDKSSYIPRKLLKIIGTITCFQPDLTRLTVKKGLDNYFVYEISKFLSTSSITDVCFDGCATAVGNFHLLLEKETNLKHISLSRCNINDEVVRNIALLLHHGRPASRKLSLLNLSSNYITDDGASYLADALRTNRKLHYLNLSNNHLTDDGALHILEILQNFPMAYDEILNVKTNMCDYLREKQTIVSRLLKMKFEEADKNPKPVKQKTTATPLKKTKTSETKVTDKPNKDAALAYQKAEIAAVSIIGEYDHPFSNKNVIVTDNYLYSKGNNSLCFLNLAYNNLTYITVRKLLSVLKYQRSMDRNGLVNVIIEGNNVPMCRELSKIDDILILNAFMTGKGSTMGFKKKSTQAGGRLNK